MRFVQEAIHPPQQCCITQRGVSELSAGRLLDTETFLPWGDPRIYISDAGMSLIAREFGYVHPDEHQKALDALSEAQGRLEMLEGELAEAQRLVDAIDAIESADFRARKKSGRKPKVKVEA